MIINPYNFGVAIDPDAQAFLTAAGITDATITSAINTLVLDLKANNLWTKLYAIYPFVGGTSTTHKFNLKNPVDTDGGRRIIFNGGWTHSSTGITGNGLNSYADTKVPFQLLGQNNAHTSIYCRTNTVITTCDLCNIYFAGSISSIMQIRESNNFVSRVNAVDFSNATIANSDSKGFYITSRTSGTQFLAAKNNNTPGTYSGNSNSSTPYTYNYFIGNYNSAGTPGVGYYSNREYSFASLGAGLTSGEMTTLYTIVQTFQTTLGRQV